LPWPSTSFATVAAGDVNMPTSRDHGHPAARGLAFPMQHHALGNTDLAIPRLVFGTSCLGNLYEALPRDVKLAISRESFAQVPAPVVLDTAGKYGAGLALEVIGANLRELGVSPDAVIISNKLGWLRKPLTTPEPT